MFYKQKKKIMICIKCGAEDQNIKKVEDLLTCTFYYICRVCGNIVYDEGIYLEPEEIKFIFENIIICTICGKEIKLKRRNKNFKPYCRDNRDCKLEYKRRKKNGTL